MNTLNRIRATLDKVLEWTLTIIMGAMVLSVLWQVFTRFILQNPSSYTEELVRFMLIWIGIMGAAYAVSKRLHLTIDYFTLKFTGRAKIYSRLFIDVWVFLFAFFAMVIGGTRLVTLTLSLQQVSAALQIKLGYVYLVVPISGLLILFYAGLQIAGHIRVLLGIEPAPAEAHETVTAID